jgi:hypothetical protein
MAEVISLSAAIAAREARQAVEELAQAEAKARATLQMLAR